MRAIILAGGRGTRLAPYTITFPKPLMPIGDLPILEIVVTQLKHAQFDRITMAVGHLAELIEAYFGDGSRFGIDIDYSRETEPLGTAGPLRIVRGIDEDVLVMNGDLLTDLDYGDLMRNHATTGAAATVGVFHRDVEITLGVLERSEDGRVTGYREKPTLEYEVSMGVYALSRRAVDAIPDGYFDLPNLVRNLIDAGETVQGYLHDGLWLDIGRPEDYENATDVFERNRARFLPGG